eukprot:Polyplicarium_translucidae@DN2027_c0_g1_i3.p1
MKDADETPMVTVSAPLAPELANCYTLDELYRIRDLPESRKKPSALHPCTDKRKTSTPDLYTSTEPRGGSSTGATRRSSASKPGKEDGPESAAARASRSRNSPYLAPKKWEAGRGTSRGRESTGGTDRSFSRSHSPRSPKRGRDRCSSDSAAGSPSGRGEAAATSSAPAGTKGAQKSPPKEKTTWTWSVVKADSNATANNDKSSAEPEAVETEETKPVPVTHSVCSVQTPDEDAENLQPASGERPNGVQNWDPWETTQPFRSVQAGNSEDTRDGSAAEFEQPMWDTPSDPPSEGFFTLGNVRDYEQRMRGAASGSGGPADLQRPPEGPPHQSRNISKSMGQHILQLLGGAPANGIPGGPGRPLPAGGGVPLQEAQRPPPGGSRGAPPRAQQLAGIERFAPDLNDEQLQKLILWASQNQKQQAVLRVLLQTVAERRHAKKKPPGWGRDDMGEVNGQDESPHRARRSAPPPQGVAPAQFAPIRGAKQQANTPSGMPPVPPVLAHEKGSSDVQRAMRPNAEAATSGGAVVEPKKSKLSANAATFHPLSFRPAPPQQQQQQYVLPPAPERPAAAAASAAWQMAADTGSAHHHHHHPSYPEASFGPPTGFCPHQQANHEAGTDGAGHRREGAAWQSQPLPKL